LRRMQKVLAPAKVNLFLRVLGKRADGFHELETIFQEIGLADELTVESAPEIAMRCSEPRIPTDDRNLVMRAAKLMHEQFNAPPVHVTLWKRIPFGGGLGGGSSDAAAMLRLLSSWCVVPPSIEEVATAALKLGSDVPFFLERGRAYARGRGEVLTALDESASIPLLLLFPNRRVSTPMAFRVLADHRKGEPEREEWGVKRAAEIVGTSSWGELVNDLESAVDELLPELAQSKKILIDNGALHALMTGSGSTVFGIFESVAARDAARDRMSSSMRCVATETVGRAASV